MKTIRFIYTIVLCAMIFTGCPINQLGPEYERHSYITHFCSLSREIDVDYSRHNDEQFEMTMWLYWSVIIASIEDTAHQQLFMELTEQNNDTSYVGTYFGGQSMVAAFAYPIMNISIKSSAAWDSMHGKGAELRDIFDIEYCSYYQNICDNYSTATHPSYYGYRDSGDFRFIDSTTKAVADLQDDDLRLIVINEPNSNIAIRFTTSVIPYYIDDRTVTISFTYDDMTFSKTFDVY